MIIILFLYAEAIEKKMVLRRWDMKAYVNIKHNIILYESELHSYYSEEEIAALLQDKILIKVII